MNASKGSNGFNCSLGGYVDRNLSLSFYEPVSACELCAADWITMSSPLIGR